MLVSSSVTRCATRFETSMASETATMRGALTASSIDIGGIAHIGVLVVGHALHGLGEQPHMLGRAMLESAEIEVLQHVEELQHRHAAAGRRAGRDAVLPIGAPQRLDHRELVAGVIL